MINTELPPRITSLTEKALLNTFILNALEPPECTKCKIESLENSVLKSFSLAANQGNLYSSPLNRSYVHIGTKPMKAALRVAYVAFVTLTISPLDLLFDGCLTLKSFVLYKAAIKTRYKDPNPEWDKTKKYAEASLRDLTTFVRGALCSTFIVLGSIYSLNCFRVTTFFMGKCTLSPIESIVHGVASGASAFVASAFMGSLGLALALPALMARKDETIGMFLALSLRNHLGLVNDNRGLLSFSNVDQIQFSQGSFDGELVDRLTKIVMDAETMLIDSVRRANSYLNKENRPAVVFTYPFDGVSVSKHFKRYIPSQYPGLIQELELMDQKVKILKNLYMSALMLTVERHPLVSLFGNSTLSFIKPKDYEEKFHADKIDNFPNFITPLNPGKKASGLSLDKNFKQNVRINKWYIENGIRDLLIPPLALLDLSEESSYEDYKKTKRQYSIRLHPDKFKNSEKANELFTYLSKVLAKIEQIFKDKGKLE